MKRALIFLALFALAADSPNAVVKYRQTVMKSMGAHMTAMSLVVKREITPRTQLAAHAEAIHALSASIPEMFPAPDKARSAARPELWTHFDEFKTLSAKLERESAALAQFAAKRDWKAFDAQFANVAKACEACHDKFRIQD
jgi:cytochrome c556